MSNTSRDPFLSLLVFVAIILAIGLMITTCTATRKSHYYAEVPTATPMETREAKKVLIFTSEGPKANYECVEVDTAGNGTSLIDCVKTWAGEEPLTVPVGSEGDRVPTATPSAEQRQQGDR